MARIIAVVNQKGGVGKTTTTVNLSAALHDLGLRTLLCDFDPQANATSGLGVEKRKISTSIYDVVINGRPLILTWCAENTEAILMAYYPGSEGGIAIAETLYGMNNPTGKLPVQLPRDMESVLNQSGDVAFDLENPLYDYGYGLSYAE